MRWHLRRLFEAAEEGDGLVEIAWTSPTYPHTLSNARMFSLVQMDDAAKFACELNQTPNRNVYFGVALRDINAPRNARGNRALTRGVMAFKIDCDKEGQLSAALDVAARMNLSPNYVIYTGQQPHLRGQAYWLLEEPCADLDLAERVDSALAARLGTDAAVSDAPRVMRLPGSVAWPLKAGRALEMTGVLSVPIREDRYTTTEVVEKLKQAGALEQQASGAVVLDFSDAEPQLDLDEMAAAASLPGNWHRMAVKATSHLVARGTPPDVVLDVLTSRLRQPGYTYDQTRAELSVMVAGALRKGWAPETAPETPQAQEAPARDPFPLLSIDQLRSAQPPEWRINKILPKRGFGVLYGASGSFKSFIALDLALSIAHGAPWRGLPVEQAPAVYIAGEGAYGVGSRVLAWEQHRKGESLSAGFWLAPVAANLLDPAFVRLVADRLKALPAPPELILVDTLARSFGAGNENDARDMNMFVAACDYLGAELKAFVLAVHHTGKDSERGARGSSVLKAACDLEISVTRRGESDLADFRITKMKEGEDGFELALEVKRVEVVLPATGEVATSRIPVAIEAPKEEPGNLSQRELRILDMLAEQPLKHATIVARMGGGEAVKKAVNRGLRRLSELNVIENVNGLWGHKGMLRDNEENQ